MAGPSAAGWSRLENRFVFYKYLLNPAKFDPVMIRLQVDPKASSNYMAKTGGFKRMMNPTRYAVLNFVKLSTFPHDKTKPTSLVPSFVHYARHGSGAAISTYSISILHLEISSRKAWLSLKVLLTHRLTSCVGVVGAQ